MKKIIFILALAACTPLKINWSPSHVLAAEQYLGYHENDINHPLTPLLGVDPTKIEWCGAFVSHILQLEGKPIADKPLWSRSYLEWGTAADTPRLGDIVVFNREESTWKGHVGFFISEVNKNGDTYYNVLSGNHMDSVSYGLYPTDQLLGIRRYEY